MKIKQLIITTMAVLLFANSSFAAEAIEETTLVVGNNRGKGGAVSGLAKIVEQDGADFTHTKSFPGKVISVDITPALPSFRPSHRILDFVNTSAPQILHSLNNVIPQRIFFEWFPSCITPSYVSPKILLFTPLLLPALKNAFNVLPTGGELIVDHLPYLTCCPVNSTKALEHLKSNGPLMQQVKSTITKHNLSTKPGIVSRLLQNHDPFSFYISWKEYSEIMTFLKHGTTDNPLPFDRSSCQFIKSKIQKIDEIIELLSTSLDLDAIDLRIEIYNGMAYRSKDIQEQKQGSSELFLQSYYMKTQSANIIKTLRDIGFTAGDDAIQYFAENPYNKRKHAWLIKATK